MHLNLLLKEKLKQKYWYVTMRDCQCNRDNTNHNQHILHWTAVLSKVLGKCITDTLPDFSEHKRPSNLCRFPGYAYRKR